MNLKVTLFIYRWMSINFSKIAHFKRKTRPKNGHKKARDSNISDKGVRETFSLVGLLE